MAAQFHQLLAQIHTQVFITIVSLVQGRQKRLLTQMTTFYTVQALKPSAPLSRPLALCYIRVATALDARVLNSRRSIRPP
ncbi:MAG TPA: hypothetical protein VF753_18000 [Terriglobales bacterium]